MKNKIKLIICSIFTIALLFTCAYASTSDALANEYYMQLYGNLYPNFNSPYEIIEQEAVVNESSGALSTNVTDYQIIGKNGFTASVVRSFNTISTEGDIDSYLYNETTDIEKCFYLDFVCSKNGETITVYFENEEELYEADPSFEGKIYWEARESGEYWYSNLKKEDTGISYTIKEPTALPKIMYKDARLIKETLGIDTDDAFINFKDGTRISKPSIKCLLQERIEEKEYTDFIFQDLNGETHAFTIVFNIEDTPDTYIRTDMFPGSPYCKYKLQMPGDNISLTNTIHDLGFEYNCILKSDDGIKYYLNMSNLHLGSTIVAAEDSFGNFYFIDVNRNDYSVTNEDGVIYNISASGITKKYNDEVTELVSYKTETINSQKDEHDKYDIDDEYVFTVTKNSGTVNNILETEEDVTKYYIKQQLKYEKIMKDGYLCTYKLPYKVEFPTGLTKHIEYIRVDWRVSGAYSDNTLTGNNYLVSRYYETNEEDVIKNESMYTYTSAEDYPYRIYISKITRKDLSDGMVSKTIISVLDRYGKFESQKINKSSGNYDLYEYGYAATYSGSPITYQKQTTYYNGSNKGSHTKNYAYMYSYYLTGETHGNYDVNYSYHTDGNYLPHETTYKTDADTTVKIVNTLTDDKKSIAKTDVYKNDVLEKSTQYTYDTYGNVASETSVIDDNTSVVTLYSYVYADDGGFTLTTTNTGLKDADGNTLPDVVTVSVYDAQYNLISQTDAKGNTTTMTYDNMGRLLSTAYPDGTIETYTYNVKDGISTYTAPNGLVYKAYFDAWGNKIKTTAMLNGSETVLDEYEYDDRNNVASYKRYIDDTNYAKATYTYDYLDRPLEEKLYDNDTLVKTTSYEYTVEGSSSSTPRDIVTATVSGDDGTYAKYSQTTNYLGFVTKQKSYTDDTERVNTFAHDYIGNVITATDNMGNVTATEYNALNNPVKVTYADGTSVQTKYNLAGLVISETDALGNTTEYEYDALGRVIKVTAPFDLYNTSVSSTYYDPNGNVTSTKTLASRYTDDEKYTYTTNSYDSMNRLINTAIYPTDSSVIYTRYEYDNMGNLTKTVSGLTSADAPDSEGQTVTYSYDALGRMISTTTPDGLSETAEYDLAGRVTETTDKAGRSTVFTYDIFDNITNTQKGDSIVAYTYNILGNRTSMTDDTGITNYTYNPFGELTQESIGSIIKSYTYDTLGRRTSIDINNGGEQILSQSYTYDVLGRLTSVENGNDTVSYTYDGNSNLLTSSYNGTQYRSYMYNYANLPILTNLSYDGTEEITNYVYTPDGNLFMSVGTDKISMYYYDGANRLVHENTDGEDVSYGETFTYDTFGNRVSLTHKDFVNNTTNTTTYVYNNINQLVSKTDNLGTTNYTYDAVGNMTSANGLTNRTYTYDAFNRLATANVDGVTSSYTYNGDNLRQTKTVNGITTRHVYDGSDIVADIGTETTTFVRGNGLALLKNGNTTNLYGIGRRGDVEHVFSNGTDNKYSYTAYGVTMGDNNYIHNPFGYAGEYTDTETGLIYLRNRYYDAELGIFITQDPIKDGLNWYAYANNNPIVLTDPTGLAPGDKFESVAEAAKDWANNYFSESYYVGFECASIIYYHEDMDGNIYYSYTNIVWGDIHNVEPGKAANSLPSDALPFAVIHSHTNNPNFTKYDRDYAIENYVTVYMVAKSSDGVNIKKYGDTRQGFKETIVATNYRVKGVSKERKKFLIKRFKWQWEEQIKNDHVCEFNCESQKWPRE